MRKITKTISILVFICAAFNLHAEESEGTRRAAADHIFVPTGFDSNDHSEVVVTGWLPNPCFQKPKAKVRVNGSLVYVSLRAEKRQSDICVTMAYPFATTVEMGKLDEGEYKVVVNPNTSAQKDASLRVAKATQDSIDDFTYANVEHVLPSQDSKTVTLTGTNPSDCMVLDEVRLVSNQKDVVAVLPIMKQVSQNCERKMVPFETTFNMPTDLSESTVLVHVRSMDGTAMNQVVERN